MNSNELQPEIAVVTPTILTGLGLKSILEKIIPVATVEVFDSFDRLSEADPERFFHFFVSLPVFVEHNAFFAHHASKTILLVNEMQNAGNQPSLNIAQSEEGLVRDILRLRQNPHRHEHPIGAGTHPTYPTTPLSPREIEVLELLTQGHINKEIAEALHISITTVISHRKNIIEKLGIRSVSGLTLYAVTNGYVHIDTL
ncbi:MAG: helix-turn-helix transcriptional regulator [Alistipes sp.]